MDPNERLCYYDPRNPLFNAYDDEPPKPRANCACDNCFYGRDGMALEIIALQEALAKMTAYRDAAHAKSERDDLAFDDQTRELENAVALLEELGPEHALEFRRRTYPTLYLRP